MLRLIKNEPSYWNFIGELRTNPLVQSGFVEQVTEFDPEKQKKYMEKYGDCYKIGVLQYQDELPNDTIPFGFVGVVDGDIRICVHPRYQNHGLGKFMLNALARQTDLSNAVAKVKNENIASQRMFLSCGYEQIGEDEDFKYYQLKK